MRFFIGVYRGNGTYVDDVRLIAWCELYEKRRAWGGGRGWGAMAQYMHGGSGGEQAGYALTVLKLHKEPEPVERLTERFMRSKVPLMSEPTCCTGCPCPGYT
jgi:hypothetical protein